MNQDDPTISTAAKIADGTSVDWEAPDSTSSSITDEALVANLQSIAAIAALHRAPSDAGPGVSGTSWGPLTVVSPIGQGRFGQVFRAWDARLAREVALKILTTEASPTAALPSRAIDEARLLARVRHPNVLTVYGAECIDGRIGIWSELVEGQTLDEIVKAHGPLPPDEVASIGIDICRALAAVHDAGFVHRDVKAQNVMREVGGRIVLMDFGTVHDTALAANGALPAGTPLYLAPEIFAGAQPSAATDQYALAVLLFRLLTNQYPVTGATLEEVRFGHAEGRTTRLRMLRPDVPEWLSVAIERGLAPDPAHRFLSARDFSRALDTEARRADAAARGSRRWIAMATVAVLAGVGLWFWLGPGRRTLGPLAETRQLTFAGNASRAVVTADGASVLYVRRAAAADELWIHSLREANSDRRLWVSAPGERIPGLTPTPDGQAADIIIHVGPNWIPDETALRRVPLSAGSAITIASGVSTPPGWSPDGRKMAYVSTRRVSGRMWTSLVVANADGSGPVPVVEAHDHYFVGASWGRQSTNRPAWSPDGRTIALGGIRLDGSEHYSSIVLADVEKRTHREVGRIDQPSLNQPEIYEVAWLDSDRLIVCRDTPGREGDYTVWLFDRRSEAFRPVTSDLAGYEGVSLTSTKQVVTARITSQPSVVWIGDLTGSPMSQVHRSSRRSLGLGGISNRGDLFFATETAEGHAVHVLEAGSSSPRVLALGQGVRLAPTQDHLVFVGTGPRKGLYRMTVDGAERAQILDGVVSGPEITPDGRHVLYNSRTGKVQGLWMVSIQGGLPRQLVGDLNVGAKAVMHDGRVIFTASGNGPVARYICTLPDCADRQQVPQGSPFGPGTALAPLASRCPGTVTRDPGAGNFWLQPAAGEPKRQLTHLPTGAISSIRLSHDCRHMAVQEDVPPTSDIVLLTGIR